MRDARGGGVGEDRVGRGASAGRASWAKNGSVSACTVSSRARERRPSKASAGGAAEVGQPRQAVAGVGQAVGLGVLEHLQPVLELAVRRVGLGERRGGGAVDPALGGERGERVEGGGAGAGRGRGRRR